MYQAGYVPFLHEFLLWHDEVGGSFCEFLGARNDFNKTHCHMSAELPAPIVSFWPHIAPLVGVTKTSKHSFKRERERERDREREER